MPKNRGGRPRQGDEVKLAPLSMRTTPKLRAQLDAAAAATGRSLTQEVERRLERSFLVDEVQYALRPLLEENDRLRQDIAILGYRVERRQIKLSAGEPIVPGHPLYRETMSAPST